jgi:hypothetical protein
MFLPTEYSSINPYQFEINRNSVALQVPLCSNSQYIGCTAKAEFNLPYTDWSIPDGTYLNFSVLGNHDACASVLCKNDPTSPSNPGSCSFVITGDVGDRIYVVGFSGHAAGFQATYNMKITCPSQYPHDSKVHVKREKSSFAQCPPADPTKVNLGQYVLSYKLIAICKSCYTRNCANLTEDPRCDEVCCFHLPRPKSILKHFLQLPSN